MAEKASRPVLFVTSRQAYDAARTRDADADNFVDRVVEAEDANQVDADRTNWWKPDALLLIGRSELIFANCTHDPGQSGADASIIVFGHLVPRHRLATHAFLGVLGATGAGVLWLLRAVIQRRLDALFR